MKRKLLLSLAVSLLSTVGAWAQTDVTSTYLTNADFSKGTPITVGTCTYAKDKASNGTEYSQLVPVESWDIPANGDARAGGLIAFGSGVWIGGPGYVAPATDSDGNSEGNILGLVGVWLGTAQYTQNVTLPAGTYTLVLGVYNSKGGTTAFSKNLIGFIEDGAVEHLATRTTYPVNSWVYEFIEFTLAAETSGKISLGYKAANSGSGAMPHLFISGMTLFSGSVDAEAYAQAKAIARNTKLVAGATPNTPVVAPFLVNGTFDSNVSGWSTTGGFSNQKRATNQAGDFTEGFFENWNGEAKVNKMYQAISNIPNGTYKLKIAAFVNTLAAEPNTTQYVYANTDKVYLTTGNPTFYEVWTVVTTNAVEVGLEQTEATANWMGIDNVTLTYYGTGDVVNDAKAVEAKANWNAALEAAKNTIADENYAMVTGEERTDLQTAIDAAEPTTTDGYNAATATLKDATAAFIAVKTNYEAWTAAKAAAEAALANEDYAAVTGDEKTALENAINAAEPTTKEDYEAAATTLNEAAAAFKAAKAAYEGLANINDVATAVGLDAAAAATSAADAIAKTQAQNVAIYNQTPKAYPYAANIGDWTKTGKTKESTGQHWNGTAESTYLEPDQWSAASVSWKLTQEKVLPAGKYILMATGRSSNDLTLEMSVLNGSEVLGSVAEFPKQDKGRGVDVNGDANFAEEGTYVNYSADDNAGRGWEWRYVPFTVASESTITLQVTATSGAKNQWASITEFRLLSAKEVNEHKLALIKAINDAQDVWDNATNVGDEVFQIPSSALEDLDDAISEAAEVRDDFEATDDEADAAKAAVEAAVEAFKNTTLNAPAEGQLFNVILTATEAGWAQENKAMTYLANDRKDQGLYNIQYKEEPNTNLAQAFTFTQVEGNNYTLSQIDADGVARYLCTGKPYGGNDNQIRTTTEVEQAMLVKIVPSATEGVYNLLNVAANNYIGSQDAGVYTVARNISFLLVEAKKPSVTVNTTEAGWGTVMFPFAVAELPEGVKAYTCDAVEGSTLTLTEVDALEANKPYIVEGAWNATLTGDAQGTALTNTVGLLTGVYADTQAPVASYVLQNQGGNVAFYLVEDGAQPTAGANHAYLTVASGVKAFFLGEVETAIQSLQAAGEGRAIYNLSGQRVQKAQRGVYVVNGKKVVVK